MKLTNIGNGVWSCSIKSLLEKEANLTFVQLGDIMLAKCGAKACQSGYGTTDPEWVGRYAISFGDINRDGTLN